jgi:hypothetical protein
MHSTGSLRPRSWSHVQTPLQMGDSRRRERYFSHGGLTPPALGAGTTAIHRKNDDFCGARAHVRPRAAGVSPPWFGETNAARRKSRTVMRPRDGRARAASVSPRWFPNAPAVADVFFRMVTRASHGWSTPAALRWACGSCCKWRLVSGVALVFAWLIYVSRCWKFVWHL